jgi:hypothetical protein
LKAIKRTALGAHTIFIETADPRQMARSVLSEVESQLNEADRLRTETVDLLSKNQPAPAMERLSGCFSTWQHAQESVLKTAQILRIDLSCVDLHGQSFSELLQNFTTQLRRIKTALESRDFSALATLLTGDMTTACLQWRQVIEGLRQTIA